MRDRGFTLVELLVVVTILTAILAPAYALLMRGEQMYDTTQQRVEGEQRLLRLAHQLRRDVRGAEHIRVEDEGRALALRTSRGRARYAWDGDQLVREAGTRREHYGVYETVLFSRTPQGLIALKVVYHTPERYDPQEHARTLVALPRVAGAVAEAAP